MPPNLMRLRGFNLPTLLALAVILVATAACGSETKPGDDSPTGGEAQVGSESPGTGTTTGGSTPAESKPADGTPTLTPVDTASAEGISAANRSLDDDSRSPTSERGLEGMLRLIPLADHIKAFVSYNDYVRAREANGIEAPGQGASDEDLSTYIRELILAGVAEGPWISGFSGRDALAQLEQRGYLGFGVGDMERSILAGEPPYVLEAATGRIDPGETDKSLAACSECPDPDIQEHLGVRFYGWGEDYQPDLPKRLQPPAYDVLGRGGRIAVLDALVFRALATEGMHGLIATYRDARDSLADDPDLTLATGLLEDSEAYSAVLLGDVGRLGSDCDHCDPAVQMVMQLAGEHSLDEYGALGAGVGRDTDGFLTIFVFVYANEEAASRNVAVFEETWNNRLSMRTARPWIEYFPQGEVSNDGRALVAKLRTDYPTIWLSMVLAADNLLWHK